MAIDRPRAAVRGRLSRRRRQVEDSDDRGRGRYRRGAPRERDLPHDSVAFERAAVTRGGAKRAEVSGCELGRRLEFIGGRTGYEVDRAADGVLRPACPAALEALRCAPDSEIARTPSPGRRGRRRRERLPSLDSLGVHYACTYSANCELAPTGVLRKRHRRGERRAPSMVCVPRRPSSAAEMTAVIAIGIVCTSCSPTFAGRSRSLLR